MKLNTLGTVLKVLIAFLAAFLIFQGLNLSHYSSQNLVNLRIGFKKPQKLLLCDEKFTYFFPDVYIHHVLDLLYLNSNSYYVFEDLIVGCQSY